jgi:HK97 family phage portal protein
MKETISNILQNLTRKIIGKNVYNEAFFSYLGAGYTSYDVDNRTYINKGYNTNPDVFACINQMATKTISVPYEVKIVNDKDSYKKLKNFQKATAGNFDFLQQIKKYNLQRKSYDEVDLPFPLEQPNPTQTWSDIWALYKTYLKLTGNCYFYLLSPEEGQNAGVPIQLYVLPAHLVQIVLKDKANMLTTENPIDHYVLIEGNNLIEFAAKDVIHIKYSNPNFDLSGSHLYGMSPLRAALRNVNSSNSGIDLNVKTLQNGGAFGFIHGKNSPLTVDQANSLKERLLEMDASPERLSRIAGASGELAFTRISLTTDELKPFDYLKYDQKAICNVLSWPDELLNNDGKASLGSTDTNQARKQAITDNILPDLVLLQDSLNKNFIKRFKGYENAVIEWDIDDLPEMQEDLNKKMEWLSKAPLTPNEIRYALKYDMIEDDGMDTVWIESNKQRVTDVSMTAFDAANISS